MSISYKGIRRSFWPDCPNHPGKFLRACVIDGMEWVFCQGVGWHAPMKWWEV